MSLEHQEAAKYQRAWSAPEYRVACHSFYMWRTRRSMFPTTFTSALDIGCGLGLLLPEWNDAGIDAWGVDIAENCLAPEVATEWGHKFRLACLWEMEWDRRFDFGICADVMEHIPPERVVQSLVRIAACCDEVLFKIDHAANAFNGDVLHLTLHPVEWWQEAMEEISGSARFVGCLARGGGILGSLVRWRVR